MAQIVRVLKDRWQGLLKLAALVSLVVLANLLSAEIVDVLQLEIRPSNEPVVHRVTMLAAATYAVLIAIPFVPGIEIGLALIGMLGPAIVFLVYVSTVSGLLIAFFVGRFVSLEWLAELLETVGLHRAGRLLRRVAPMDAEQRQSFLLSNARPGAIPFLVRHRYVALALVINVPGNILIGGGGGISLMAGASRLYSPLGFLATIIIAVAPVPLAILIFGPQIFG